MLFQVTNSSQHTYSICFINTDPILLCLTALPSGASIILSSTVSPGFVSRLDQRLQSIVYMCHVILCHYGLLCREIIVFILHMLLL